MHIIDVPAAVHIPSRPGYLGALDQTQAKVSSRDECASALTLGAGRVRAGVVEEGFANLVWIREGSFFRDEVQDTFACE